MSASICQQCSASVRGYVCDYCGSLAQSNLDQTAEKEALNEFHAVLASQTDMETKARLLRHGFLPDAPPVLIESGMRCIPLIDIDDPAEDVVTAAAHRLRAIMAKLRLLGEDAQTAAALREFETVLAKYKLADRQLTRTVIIIGVVLLILLGAGCFWLLGFLLL